MLLPVMLEKPKFTAVSLEEAKKHLDVVGFDDDDEQITGLIRAATEHLGKTLGLTLCKTKFRQDFMNFREATELSVAPANEIEAIKCVNVDDSEFLLPPSQYSLVKTHDGTFIHYNGELPCVAKRIDAVQVTFYAGFDKEDVPASLKAAILLHIGLLYEHREDLSVAKPIETNAYNALIWPWRRLSV